MNELAAETLIFTSKKIFSKQKNNAHKKSYVAGQKYCTTFHAKVPLIVPLWSPTHSQLILMDYSRICNTGSIIKPP